MQKACLTGPDALVRDSCVILTQTYAAFGRAPELSWLGLPTAVIEHGVPLLRHRVLSTRDPNMIDRIATALGDLRQLYGNESASQSAVEEAIASGGLVLLKEGRQAHWETQVISHSWQRHKALWKLLWALGSKALHGASVTEKDLDADSGTLSKLATTVNRLKNVLPPSLRQCIQTNRGDRSYRLRLEKHQVHLF